MSLKSHKCDMWYWYHHMYVYIAKYSRVKQIYARKWESNGSEVGRKQRLQGKDALRRHRCGKLPGGYCATEELYISKSWKQARDKQTEKFAGSFKLTYGCTFSLTSFAKGKCGNWCFTPPPLYIDWKQQEQEEEMYCCSSSVIKLWRAVDIQRLKVGHCEPPSETERRAVCFFLQIFSPTSTVSLSSRYMSNSTWHIIFPAGTLMTLLNCGLGDVLSSEKKQEKRRRSNESLILQSKRAPTITIGEEAWGEYWLMLLTRFCCECGRKPSPPASKPNTPIRPP